MLEGFGEACLPKISILLVVCAGKAGTYHQQRMILWRAAKALQTSQQNATCVSPVIKEYL